MAQAYVTEHPKADAWANPEAPSVGTFAIKAVVCLLLIHLSGAWFWGKAGENFHQIDLADKPGGVAFQYFIWACLCVLFGRQILSARFGNFIRGWIPLMPVFLLGCLALASSDDIAWSLRSLALWAVLACAASVAGQALANCNPDKTVAYVLFFLLAVSLVYGFALPQYGQQHYEGKIVLRGLFLGKNLYGWLGAVGLMIALFGRGLEIWLRAALALSGALSILASNSMGSAMSALGVFPAMALVWWFRKRSLPPAVSFPALMLTAALGAACIYGASTMALDAVGRDMTLTGRTEIWATFTRVANGCQPFGCGPGMFSGPTDLTTPLAAELFSYGDIFTPHNSYIAVYGEGGLLALVAFIGAYLFLGWYEPIARRHAPIPLSVPLTILVTLDGMVETHSPFIGNLEIFLIIFFRSAWLSGAKRKAPTP